MSSSTEQSVYRLSNLSLSDSCPSNELSEALQHKLKLLSDDIKSVNTSTSTEHRYQSRFDVISQRCLQADQFWSNPSALVTHETARHIRSNMQVTKPSYQPINGQELRAPPSPMQSPMIIPMSPPDNFSLGASAHFDGRSDHQHCMSLTEPNIDYHLNHSSETHASSISENSRPSSSQSIHSLSSSYSVFSFENYEQSFCHPVVQQYPYVCCAPDHLQPSLVGSQLECPYSFTDTLPRYGGFLVPEFELSLKRLVLFDDSLDKLHIQLSIELPDRIRAVDLLFSVSSHSIVTTAQSIAHTFVEVLPSFCRNRLFLSLIQLLHQCMMEHPIMVYEYYTDVSY